MMFITRFGQTHKFSSKSFFNIGPLQQEVQLEFSISSFVGLFLNFFLFFHQILMRVNQFILILFFNLFTYYLHL